MIYTRAPASDFDDWGADGWESENLIPLMKKVVKFAFHMFLKLNPCILRSWRHMRSSLMVQLTGTMDLSRYLMVVAQQVSGKSSCMSVQPITRGHMPTTQRI